MTRSARARVVAHALLGGLLAGPALLALPGSAVAAESLSYVTMNYATAGKLWRTGTASITTNGTASTTAHVSMYDNSGGA